MRMSTRRFTRLTNGSSKKLENHCHALALYFVFYNWMRIPKTLRVTPATAAGLADRLWTWEDIIATMDAQAEPKKRGSIPEPEFRRQVQHPSALSLLEFPSRPERGIMVLRDHPACPGIEHLRGLT
jgi:hypothetical protein